MTQGTLETTEIPAGDGRGWQARFLTEFAQTGQVGYAAALANVSRATVYRERKRNAEFAAAWKDAEDWALDEIEAAAHRKALAGDSALLIFLLKTRRPETYSLDNNAALRRQLAELEQEVEVMRIGFRRLAERDQQLVVAAARDAQARLEAQTSH